MALGLNRVLGPIQGKTGTAWARPLAWVVLDGFSGAGPTYAIVDSFNISSITENAAGDFTLAFAIAMANATYVVTGMLQATATAVGGINVSSTTGQTISTVRCQAFSYAGANTRFPYNSVVIIGKH